jgi:hypothetical protein
MDMGWTAAANPDVFTKRVGHSATTWHDTVVVIGGRDGCARAMQAMQAREGSELTQLTPRVAARVTLRTTFCNDVLFYDLYARTWRRVVECAPRALVLSTRASLPVAPLPRALTAPRAVRLSAAAPQEDPVSRPRLPHRHAHHHARRRAPVSLALSHTAKVLTPVFSRALFLAAWTRAQAWTRSG